MSTQWSPVYSESSFASSEWVTAEHLIMTLCVYYMAPNRQAHEVGGQQAAKRPRLASQPTKKGASQADLFAKAKLHVKQKGERAPMAVASWQSRRRGRSFLVSVAYTTTVLVHSKPTRRPSCGQYVTWNGKGNTTEWTTFRSGFS